MQRLMTVLIQPMRVSPVALTRARPTARARAIVVAMCRGVAKRRRDQRVAGERTDGAAHRAADRDAADGHPRLDAALIADLQANSRSCAAAAAGRVAGWVAGWRAPRPDPRHRGRRR